MTVNVKEENWVGTKEAAAVSYTHLYRVQPECPLYARCGGCQIQAMDYRQQLCYKQKKVRGNLIRIGGFAPELIDSVMEEIVGMEQPYRYRNKAQFPIGADRDGMPVAGFYAARTHSIIPVEDCKPVSYTHLRSRTSNL